MAGLFFLREISESGTAGSNALDISKPCCRVAFEKRWVISHTPPTLQHLRLSHTSSWSPLLLEPLFLWFLMQLSCLLLRAMALSKALCFSSLPDQMLSPVSCPGPLLSLGDVFTASTYGQKTPGPSSTQTSNHPSTSPWKPPTTSTPVGIFLTTFQRNVSSSPCP